VAWHSIKPHLLSGDTVVLPSLTRKTTKASIFRQYSSTIEEGDEMVGHTSAFEVFKTITRKEVKSRQSVDYYETDLLHMVQARLRSLIMDAVDDNDELCTTLLAELEVVFSTVQFSYPERIEVDVKYEVRPSPTPNTCDSNRSTLDP